MPSAYGTTEVPVARSQESIRQLLIKFGTRGVQFTEDFDDNIVNVKFAKKYNDNVRTVSVTMKVPEPIILRRRTKSDTQRQEQMKRATYRALHDWLKAQFVAVEFGLLSFEDVFLSHFEWILKDGSVTTVGKYIQPRLASSVPLLSAGNQDIEDASWKEI